jgi:hypothetical protein
VKESESEVLKVEESDSELLCTDSTALLCRDNFKPLKTKRNFFIRTQCVPRCKHSPLRSQKPVS